MTVDRKAMSSSALRRRRQAIKKARAELKRELAAIEAEMVSRKEPKPSIYGLSSVDKFR